jgi:hypothetical protein
MGGDHGNGREQGEASALLDAEEPSGQNAPDHQRTLGRKAPGHHERGAGKEPPRTDARDGRHSCSDTGATQPRSREK